jgi:SAM-dependent methyltransferase
MQSANANPVEFQSSIPDLEKRIVKLYAGAPLAARTYLRIRIRNYPRLMWNHLSGLNGNFVSLGAGYAVLEAMAALLNPDARITASDRQAQRVSIAGTALHSIPNLTLAVLDLREGFPDGRIDGFLLLDVLHHLSPDIQELVLKKCASSLPENGRIVIKECGTRPAWKKWVNYLNDAIGAPFERTYPRSEQEWAKQLESLGLSTKTIRIDEGSPYAHIMVIGSKSPRQT